jgi:hypothetical protein
MRRWAAAPFYGAFLAPIVLILRELGALVLAGVGAGAALALIVRGAFRYG